MDVYERKISKIALKKCQACSVLKQSVMGTKIAPCEKKHHKKHHCLYCISYLPIDLQQSSACRVFDPKNLQKTSVFLENTVCNHLYRYICEYTQDAHWLSSMTGLQWWPSSYFRICRYFGSFSSSHRPFLGLVGVPNSRMWSLCHTNTSWKGNLSPLTDRLCIRNDSHVTWAISEPG